MYDLNARIVRVMLACAAIIIFLLGFLVCADVIGRAFFNSPVKGTPEIVSMSIVIICFLLAGYAVQSGGMIYTGVIVDIFGVRGQAFAQLLSALLGAAFFAIIVWGSYEPTLHAIASGEYEGEGALRVPVWPARVIVVIGSVLIITSYLLLAASAIATLISGGTEDTNTPTSSTHI
jgi:TRAP-type C4-dicarboxylate transport system permease small subunit